MAIGIMTRIPVVSIGISITVSVIAIVISALT
nr:MAG TPA: hypothetical protein [Caudoviricetes sp.]